MKRSLLFKSYDLCLIILGDVYYDKNVKWLTGLLYIFLKTGEGVVKVLF